MTVEKWSLLMLLIAPSFAGIVTETFYWFGDNNFTEWKPLIDLYTPPPYFLPGLEGAYSFGLAGEKCLIYI